MNFGQAIEAMKQGKRCSRSCWNGKGMFVYLVGQSRVSFDTHGQGEHGLTADWLREEDRLTNTVGLEKSVERFDAYLVIFTAQKTLQPGWLASQSDMLSEDWETVENDKGDQE